MTLDQRKQIIRFMEDGIDAVNLQENGAQRLIENGEEFQTELKKLVKRFSITDQYADEEVESSYGYPSGYKPKGITEQVSRLRELFPNIGYANEKFAEQVVPENAEGLFAIPRWEKVAPTYGEAVQKVFDLIKQTRNGAFYNYHKDELGQSQLRQSAKCISFFQKLGNEQKDQDVLVVPAQFGIRHRGRSVRRAREVMNANECGLGAFAIGIMLLTHPERLMQYDDLWIDCAGDEFAPRADGVFSKSPYFGFNKGEIKFVTDSVNFAYDRYGSASAYLPQVDTCSLGS